ncbi:sterol desaturase family protein [Hahella ganghwensis]|uniref:sterol desaturase family protein n=1 Tax=Hahella ganghwensis TaxID=286420 RepID=UPI0003639243|nr:sterol desaturase family protein [Hahella ganghwensis]
MQALLYKTLLPLSVILSLSTFLWARQTGGHLEMMVFISGILTFVLALILEAVYRLPQITEPVADKERVTDWISLAVILGVMEPLLKATMPLMVIGAGAVLLPDSLLSLFPDHVHFGWQVLITLLTAELLFYWVHRLHHTIPTLWWLHALHHNPTQVNTVNGFRLHPFNHLINSMMGIFPLLLIGIPHEVLLAYAAITQPIIILQHADLPLQHGLLNHLFSTNQVHRWHHSNRQEEGNSNYGRSLIIFDKLFGTFYLPNQQKPEAYGLFSLSRYPSGQSYWKQVMSIFRPDCCQ